MLRKVIQVDEERPVFQLFFLKDNESQSVEIVEIEEIDFRGVKERLEQGESVFITLKRKEKVETRLVKEEALAEPLYFTRI
jgi:hypothetical protein